MKYTQGGLRFRRGAGSVVHAGPRSLRDRQSLTTACGDALLDSFPPLLCKHVGLSAFLHPLMCLRMCACLPASFCVPVLFLFACLWAGLFLCAGILSVCLPLGPASFCVPVLFLCASVWACLFPCAGTLSVCRYSFLVPVLFPCAATLSLCRYSFLVPVLFLCAGALSLCLLLSVCGYSFLVPASSCVRLLFPCACLFLCAVTLPFCRYSLCVRVLFPCACLWACLFLCARESFLVLALGLPRSVSRTTKTSPSFLPHPLRPFVPEIMIQKKPLQVVRAVTACHTHGEVE